MDKILGAVLYASISPVTFAAIEAVQFVASLLMSFGSFLVNVSSAVQTFDSRLKSKLS